MPPAKGTSRLKHTATFGIALAIATTLLTACRAGASEPTLAGKPWALTAVTSKTPAFQGVVPDYQQPDYEVTFNAGGSYSGTAACNQIAGTYKTSGTNVTISAGASTLAFCLDSAFGAILPHSLPTASTFALTGDTLTLSLSDGGTLSFGPLPVAPSSAQSSAVASLAQGASPPAELLGKVWKLTAITELNPAFQGVVPAAEQGSYTIGFEAGGRFSAKADCDQVGGAYEVHRGDGAPGPLESGGGSISILPGPSTLAACRAGSMGDLYVVGLGNLSSFTIEGDQLTLTLRDGGKLVFGT